MADQVLSVAFKLDTSNIDADASAAGKLAAKAFQDGFGSIDLKTPIAQGVEAAKAQTAIVGKALQAAFLPQTIAPQAIPSPVAPTPTPKPAPAPEASHVANAADLAGTGFGVARAGFEGLSGFIASGSIAGAIGTLTEIGR